MDRQTAALWAVYLVVPRAEALEAAWAGDMGDSNNKNMRQVPKKKRGASPIVEADASDSGFTKLVAEE